MSVGQKYKNELLVIGREPSYWPAVFSTEELNEMGAEYIFNTKVRYHAINTSYNSMLDPFWGCTKEILIKLGICQNETNWSSYIALSYLYKIAFSNNRYLMDKPRMMQLEYCKEIFELEISALRPKRILFLTGMKYARDFLNLSDCSGLEDCVSPSGSSLSLAYFPSNPLITISNALLKLMFIFASMSYPVLLITHDPLLVVAPLSRL
jgi:hypothetical protein